MLTLKPDEFSGLQIHEFNAMVQGYLRRKREDDERQAYFICWQIQPQLSSESKLTPADILEPLYPDVKPDPEEDRAKLLKAFGM